MGVTAFARTCVCHSWCTRSPPPTPMDVLAAARSAAESTACECLFVRLRSVLLDKYPEVGLLGPTGARRSPFASAPYCFPQQLHHLPPPQQHTGAPFALRPHRYFFLRFLTSSHPNRWEAVPRVALICVSVVGGNGRAWTLKACPPGPLPHPCLASPLCQEAPGLRAPGKWLLLQDLGLPACAMGAGCQLPAPSAA